MFITVCQALLYIFQQYATETLHIVLRQKLQQRLFIFYLINRLESVSTIR